MKRKNIFRYIILPLLLVIAAACWYVYTEYNRTHKNTASLKPDYSMNAAAIVDAFVKDEQASNKKYWDKVLEINGMVKEITADGKGLYTIAIGDTASMSSVRCSVDSIHSKTALAVTKGIRATVKGICTGFNLDELLGSDVLLVRCVVVSPQHKSDH